MEKYDNMENSQNITKSDFGHSAENINNTNSSDREAFLLERKADNKLNPGCCLDIICTSKTKRYEDACNLYEKAGNKYKESHQWRKAADCYENCSKIKIDLKQNPLKYYQESFFCYTKANSDINSKKIFEKMNQCLEKEGDFYQAGKNSEQMGIKNENNEYYNEAINYYSQASYYYELDGKHESLKNNMQIKVAELMMLYNHPDAPSKVPTIMENLAKNYLKNPITKYTAKDYFGKAILSGIYFNNDISEGKRLINKYKEIDPSFEESSIYNLCYDIIKSIENNDINNLKKSIQNYKEISDVDEFTNKILDKIIEKTKKRGFNGENNNNSINVYEEDFK